MCGIVGYVGLKECVNIIFNGLKRLEYRGYDSAGIAVLYQDTIHCVKKEGKLAELYSELSFLPPKASLGIGHTRWATHGAPTTNNAHPHVNDKIAIVHNGIIENYKDLKEGLLAGGVVFNSETDTEVILHLFYKFLKDFSSPKDAIIQLIKTLKGAYALGIMISTDSSHLYLVKQGSPLVIGLGDKETFFGSDVSAIVEHTQKAIFLQDGEFAQIGINEIKIWDFNNNIVIREPVNIEWTPDSIQKKGFAHYMLKEIYEQPSCIANLIMRLINKETGDINYDSLGLQNLNIEKVNKIDIVACGTAYYSGLIGKYMLETIANIPINVELASEFRYRKPYINNNTLLIAISQSGETADTLACVKYAKECGAQVYSICNVKYSSIPRESHAVLYMEVGPEIGVASTKAFTGMILSQFVLALALAHIKFKKEYDKFSVLHQLRQLPSHIDKILANAEDIKKIANKFYRCSNFLYIARGEQYPIALEGALKLKEISYIHAEGYAAGELKHGPIALVDQNMPVLAIVPHDSYYEKTISNIEEVRARRGEVIIVGSQDDEKLCSLSSYIINCPQMSIAYLQTILSIIPLQLFAYYVAVKRGTDVDQPRNLAKSVTVE